MGRGIPATPRDGRGLRARLSRILRTAWGRVGLLLIAIAAVWIITVTIAEAVFDAYPSQGEALWRGLAHLLDPGSLGDDETAAQRSIGVVQAIAGIVLLAGVVLAVASEVIGRGLQRLERLDPALDVSDHILVVAEADRARDVVARIAAGAPGATVAVLLPPDMAGGLQQARSDLRVAAPGVRVEVVTGDATTRHGLERACAAAARSITVLSPAAEDDAVADIAVMDIGWAIGALLEDTRRVGIPVGLDLRRGRNVDALLGRYPAGFDAVVRDRYLGGLIALSVFSPRFAAIISGAAEGSESFIRTCGAGEDAGRTFAELADGLDGAVALGTIRPTADGGFAAHYAPPVDHRLAPDERAIVLAASATSPVRAGRRPAPSGAVAADVIVPEGPPRLDLLVIGWSPACEGLADVARHLPPDRVRVTVLVDPARGHLPPPPFSALTGDISDPATLARTLEDVRPLIALVASAGDTGGTAEARAALAALHLTRSDRSGTIPILLEQHGVAPEALLRGVGGRVHVLSAPTAAAERAALAAVDPAALMAQEALMDADLRLSEAVYRPGDDRPATLGAIAAALRARQTVPLVVARDEVPLGGGDMAAVEVLPGDRLLVVSRIGARVSPPG